MSSATPRIDETTSLDDLAHLICETLAAHGIDTILSGGAVVSLYTHNDYLSYDLDFITSTPIANIAPILKTIGFTRQSGRHFAHRKCPFEIEFPGNVVMIGRSLITAYREDSNELGTLRLLTPTHTVMDRLAAFQIRAIQNWMRTPRATPSSPRSVYQYFRCLGPAKYS